MSKRILLITPLFLAFFVCQAQQTISTSSERNADNSISIYAENPTFCNYTLKLFFPTLTGYISSISGNPGLVTVGSGRSQICKLTPDKSMGGMGSSSYSYQTRFFEGISFRKAPSEFGHYILPTTAGNEIVSSEVQNLKVTLGQKPDDNFYSIGFNYKMGDTICATRTGYVYTINDNNKKGESKQSLYTASRNKISIQHKDGTLGFYNILSPIQSLVENGDFVIAGQPIAIFNQQSDKYTVLFSVNYLDENKLRNENAAALVYSNLPLHFYLGENEKEASLDINKHYVSLHSTEVITQELSKKEKKKLVFQ
jgi:hypothetical protein